YITGDLAHVDDDGYFWFEGRRDDIIISSGYTIGPFEVEDVFGYFVDDEDFLMGEDVYTPGKEGDALRSMSNPEQFGQPAHMKDYVFTEKDNGGVHTNSGIPNKAAYNVIQAIGKAKAEQIYYRALTEYLTS
ncbi:M4 family metallopeptidase, partial [Staphylococcus aureus]|uniref:M4 family metallopeptidase n=1 Tax=Staphylococcus aureus TaxID=1280 RepID=UPI00210C1E20